MISKNIKKYREDLNISQRELARRSNISGQMVSKIENNLTKPSLDTLNKIAAALGVSVNELISDDTLSLTDMDKEDKSFYLDCVIEKPELMQIIELFKSRGYKLNQELQGSDLYLNKDNKIIAKISEEDFINFGMSMINNINEFTEFQFNKLIDMFTILS